jgi:hypothetical protein
MYLALVISSVGQTAGAPVDVSAGLLQAETCLLGVR